MQNNKVEIDQTIKRDNKKSLLLISFYLVILVIGAVLTI